ncbi:RHS repeat-associated protein [Aquimarina sp. EL_43]|uniref:FG-GAP-like repeat-containing protein n=1 Tax=unclassified Aquimarina TaxID=2627091 RepID=UPI0018C9682E|nr:MULTISPECIES: FG-GAP-like repeat-containing protein [unclassified Aquimarina]MBG6131248.1 RHS repeat-associated protein [Aquimarina sp. EL_35]MBG6151870.1 RHS repeat-associated protein [Aquimarina sp. EL_32]MBG6169800.1 RHS repeat-associated protein [Aquimarina sp. EL_43]
MKTNLYITCVWMLLLTGILSRAQDSTNLNPKDEFTYQTHTASVEEPETLFLSGGEPAATKTATASRSSSSGIGETSGSLSVSPAGGANYVVPIAVPPGIGGVAPEIAISYDSQAGNGIAGWGWNVSGLSVIKRIPATQYHDGGIDPVDFDAKDRFALDGQRLLLKSGTYGANGAVYETENYSNLKITSFGTSPYGTSYGPAYFVVQYPDGSVGHYGNNTNSRSRLEYALTYWENPLGIRINYSYRTVSDKNIISIEKITYGAKGAAASINEIRFEYGNRTRNENSYINGILFIRETLLKEIKVFGNGTPYRNYVLNHDATTLGYDRVIGIQEKTGDNTQSHSPILFTYPITASTVTHTPTTSNLGVVNIEQRNAETVSLDLTGNGKMDFIVYPKNTKDKFWIFKGDKFNIPSTINTGGKFEKIFPVTLLNQQNKLLAGQGLTVIQNKSDNKVDFKVYSNGTVHPIYLQYTKTWTAPAPTDCVRIPQNYISGDFNGDGLTDIVAVSGRCRTTNTAKVTLINLDKRLTSNFAIHTGTLQSALSASDRLFPADVNGDGKTDILQIKSGQIYVYTITDNNALQLLWKNTTPIIKSNLPVLLGDYNGDGKADFLMPHKNNTTAFNLFASKGNDFLVTSHSNGFRFNATNFNGSNGVLSGYNLIPVDINGDGKTDIIDYSTTTTNNSTTGTQNVKVFYNKSPSSFTSAPKFTEGGSISVNTNLKHFPIPIFLSSNQPNYALEFASISNQWISSFSFTQDHKKDVTLKNISNNGVGYHITYSNLNTENQAGPPVYTRGYDQFYPYVDIAAASGIQLVSTIERSLFAGGPRVKKEFYYKGAVSNLEGLGFSGFQYMASSNWHTDGSDRIFNNYVYNPRLRGAVIQEYQTPSTHRFGTIPSDYIYRIDNTYRHSIASNKMFKMYLKSSIHLNQLLGTNIRKSFLYDSYNNPIRETVNYVGTGTTTTSIANISSTSGSNYYIGRPTTKKITSTIGSDSFYSEERYTYSGALMTRKDTRGNGTRSLTEMYRHDAFGNITEITVRPFRGAQRRTKYEYEASGRFLKKSTDLDGLQTTYEYNASTGMLTKETDPYNLSTNYQYDKWNRLVKATDYLGNSATTSYVESKQYYYTVTHTAADGSMISSQYDPLQRKVNDRKISQGGQWIQVTYEYDALGRLSRQSEPHFGNAPTQWNTTEYDRYSRIKRQSLYTGKNIDYSYNKLTTTVNDGTKTVTTTRDAMGNVVKVNDPGGTITYTHFGNGAIKTSSYGGVTQTIEQDKWGRRTKLTDPSAGVYTYEYNGFNEITKEVGPKGTTEYTYTYTGKIQSIKVTGDHTNMTTNYSYDNSTKLLSGISGSDVINGKMYNYVYAYDSYKRIQSLTEDTGSAQFEKQYSYDSMGRLQQEQYKATTAGKTSTSSFTYSFDTYGAFTGIDNWNIKTRNAREQITDIQLGTGQVQQTRFDAYGFVKSNTVADPNQNKNDIENTYAFNPIRGTLSNRTHKVDVTGHTASYSETFTYDSQDRLTEISGPFARTNAYDGYGRITNTSAIGGLAYQGGSKQYQLKEMTLNAAGAQFYQNHALQQITYNAFKKPVDIHEADKGRVSFEYGPFHNRTGAWYGGLATDKTQRRYHKQYASIIPAEIVHDTQENSYKFVFFNGGDAYSAPIAKIEKFTSDTSDGGSIYHLQRDYLGSILNITKQVETGGVTSGVLQESRQFGAWGTVDAFWSQSGSTTMDHNSLLDRGYTGHEHFGEVSLIHMNGRMYDPQLGRFLSPDNHIQNPYNTQNYNRYGYVLNNPLMYTDPSGETMQEEGEGGTGWIYWAVVGVVSAYQSLRGAPIGRWLEANHERRMRDVNNFFDRIFGGSGSSAKPTTIEYNQTQVMSDPLMNPNPGIAATYMSNGGGGLDLMHSSFVAFQAGQLNYVASITRGIKTLFTNPSSLFTVDTYLSAVSQGIEMAYPHFRAARTNSRLQQAAGTGDVNHVFYALGGESANLQMESLSLIPGAGIVGRAGKVARGVPKLLQRFNSVESLVGNAGKLKRLKGGLRQGSIQGNANDIFKGLSQQYGAKVQINGAEMFFKSGDIRIGLHNAAKGGGVPTLHIKNASQLYKIRVIPW